MNTKKTKFEDQVIEMLSDRADVSTSDARQMILAKVELFESLFAAGTSAQMSAEAIYDASLNQAPVGPSIEERDEYANTVLQCMADITTEPVSKMMACYIQTWDMASMQMLLSENTDPREAAMIILQTWEFLHSK